MLSRSGFAWADDDEIESQLKFVYAGNVLTLRHFYSGEHLRFHSDGTLNVDGPVGPWTLDSQIAVKEIHLHGGLLLIKGRRIRQTFDSKGKPHDLLTTIDDDSGKDHDALQETLNSLAAEIEIELPGEKPDQNEISSAMNHVFLVPGESMVDIVPTYWRAYFAKSEGKPKSVPVSKGPLYYIKQDEVSPPRIKYDPDPAYSPEAQKAKQEGTVVVSLIVDASGALRDLQIKRPLGLAWTKRQSRRSAPGNLNPR